MELEGTKVYMARTDRLQDEQIFRAYYETVSKERQEKIDRLRFSKDKRLSLAAAVLLNKVLKEAGVENYALSYGEKGKPYLEGFSNIKFNLSHSEERVLCVISSKETGCDVEKIRDTNFKLADYFLTEEEKAVLKKEKTEEEKRDLFFRFWTLKESFLKATGLGMSLSLKDFHFQLEKNIPKVCQKVNGEQYYFKEYDLKDGYRYTVCSICPMIGELIEVTL